MTSSSRRFFLIIVIALIIGGVFYLQRGQQPGSQNTPRTSVPSVPTNFSYELVNASGVINTQPFTLSEYVGKEIILVDFWTYSCINCQRTIPYLNAWYEKYGNKGLLMVGVHTPEFEFEKVQANVEKAVNKFGIKYPVVMDNNYATWGAYSNRYWPHKYLFDISGELVYDHIGEGSYAETEKKIQALLAERAKVLGVAMDMPKDTAVQKIPEANLSHVKSPEIYFGANRNQYLGNGIRGKEGNQTFVVPNRASLNTVYLGGSWNTHEEFAENTSANARIVFKFNAQHVYMVASSALGTHATILLDGTPAPTDTDDVKKGSTLLKEDRLYHLITLPAPGPHTLEIQLDQPGLRAFTFTFG